MKRYKLISWLNKNVDYSHMNFKYVNKIYWCWLYEQKGE